jgi:hypothetical protein
MLKIIEENDRPWGTILERLFSVPTVLNLETPQLRASERRQIGFASLSGKSREVPVSDASARNGADIHVRHLSCGDTKA